MKAIPQNNYVLCKQINETKHQTIGLFIYEKEELPIYEIINIGEKINDFSFNVGDNVICCSTGTKIILDSNTYYLFDKNNIVGKIS